MIPFPLPPSIGPVESEASVTADVVVGHAYFAPAPPPVPPVAHVPELTSSPQGWIPNHVVPTVIVVGVVESAMAYPESGLIK